MITSASNPKLRLIHRLLDSRRQREKEGLFVVEGEDLVQAADDAGIDPVELLRAGEEVEPELLAKVSDMGHPPRVMGIYRREALPRGVEPVSLALWHEADPGNLGAILRTADAFGASVALSSGCADPTRSGHADTVSPCAIPRTSPRCCARCLAGAPACASAARLSQCGRSSRHSI